MSKIGKKISNKFWREVFCSVCYFMQGALYCVPENLVIAPLWDNPLITKNNKPLKKSSYPNLATKISTISEFYQLGSEIMLTRDELENKFELDIDQNTYIEFKYIILTARRSLGITDNTNIMTFLTSQPLLIKIANSVKKGCSAYYRLIRNKETSK